MVTKTAEWVEGSSFKAKVLGFNQFDQTLTLSNKPDVMEEALTSMNNLSIGQVIMIKK